MTGTQVIVSAPSDCPAVNARHAVDRPIRVGTVRAGYGPRIPQVLMCRVPAVDLISRLHDHRRVQHLIDDGPGLDDIEDRLARRNAVVRSNCSNWGSNSAVRTVLGPLL